MNNLIIYMTLTGILPIVIYYIIRFILQKGIAAKMIIKLLYISMLFFLLPLPMFSTFLKNHSPLPLNNDTILSVIDLSSKKLILISENSIKLQHYSRVFYIISFTWLVYFIVSVCKTFCSYRKFRKDIHNATRFADKISIKNLCFKRKIEIRLTAADNTMPFSTGFFHPLIVLPENLSSDESYCILLHELSHIKHMDFLTRYIALFIRSLHWFNPFSYRLLRELEIQQEFRADEVVLSELSYDLQNKYGTLILESVTTKTMSAKDTAKYLSTFGNSNYAINEERIKRVKNTMNHIKTKKASTVIIAIIISILGNCLTIMAYQPPYILTDEVSTQFDYISFTPDGCADESSFIDFANSDYIFIDEAGICTEISLSQINNKETRIVCSHNWIQGTLQKHKKNSDGSCDVITCEATRCTKCGAVYTGAEISTTHYKKCPH